MKSAFLKSSTAWQELEQLEHHHELEDAAGATYERVVWRHTVAHKTNRLDILSLASSRADYPSLFGVHIGDPDFWFEKLVDEYGRQAKAWVIEIMPVPGDHLTDDPQYTTPDMHGNKGDSKILVTSREILREGEDFEYVRELTAEDLPDDDEDEESGYLDYGYGYGDDDEADE